MSGYTIRRIEEMGSLHHGAVKLAGAELGVESFGMQVLDLPAGFDDYPEHDHTSDGMEEVYTVLGGDAVFEIEGEHVPVAPGDMVRIGSDARRRLLPGSRGVRVLVVGCTPGSYSRPEAFVLAGKREGPR